MNYTGKINLMKLNKAALVKGKNGQRCVLIDIKESSLYLSEKTDAVYLDFVCWDYASEYSSHNIRQQLSKERREFLKALPKEERYKQDPIIGNLQAMPEKDAPPVGDFIDGDCPF